jgi:hypothetical protein
MERERQKLDRQLDLAQEKSKKANIGQEVLEAKMKVKNFSLIDNIGNLGTSMNDIIMLVITVKPGLNDHLRIVTTYLHYFGVSRVVVVHSYVCTFESN